MPVSVSRAGMRNATAVPLPYIINPQSVCLQHQSDHSLVSPSHSWVGQTHHSFLGGAMVHAPPTPTPSLTRSLPQVFRRSYRHSRPRCLVGQTFESKAPVRVPKEKPLSRSGRPESITCPRVDEVVVSGSSDCGMRSNLPSTLSLVDSFTQSLAIPSPNITSNKNKPPSDSLAILHPREPIHVAAFNVRTLLQVGQQASLAQTLFSLKVDVCCVSETRIQDPSTVIQISPPGWSSTSPAYSLRVSGDSAARSRGQAGVGIALSRKAEGALLDWIPVNSRLCAVRLNGSTKVNRKTNRRRCLFIVSVYAPTDCSSDDAKDEFYSDLVRLLGQAKRSDIVLVAGDFNSQVGRLMGPEKRLGGHFGVHANRTDNGERLLNLCADKGLFLASTNFEHKKRQCVTWRPSLPSQPWTQIDHIAISYRWRGSVEDCRSFWSTCLDSDHALVRARLSLHFTGRRKICPTKLPAIRFHDETTKGLYQTNLLTQLSSSSLCNESDADWNRLRNAMSFAIESSCSPTGVPIQKQWITSASAALISLRQSIPSDTAFDTERKFLRRQLTKSLRKDREQWWKDKACEMEKANAIGNSRQLFQLIRNTGPRRPDVSELISDKQGVEIHSIDKRLNRWAEHFEEQFSWPVAVTELPCISPAEVWDVNLDSPTSSEIEEGLRWLKRNKAAGPDGLSPSLFKEGGQVIVQELTSLLQCIWETERVPQDWCKSVVVPIFKKGDRTSCENHRGISLVSVASKLLTGLLLRRLTCSREKQIRENQAGFRPGRGCIDQIFTLRQILELRHTYRRPTITVFLDLKAAFDSVDRDVLWRCLSLKGVPQKFITLLQSLYSNSCSRVRAYGELSSEFTTLSGVRQGCPISPFLFNFVIDLLMETALSGCENSGIDVLPSRPLSDLEYADDIVLFSEDVTKMQNLLNNLDRCAGMFGLRFAPSKCKCLLQDWETPIPSLLIAGCVVECVDNFTYLGSCISSHGDASAEVSERIRKARLAFVNLRHLWKRRDVRLSTKGRVYAAAVRPVLLYATETWPLRSEDIRRLSVFDHRCLRSIARVRWENRVSNTDIRRRVFGVGEMSVERLMNLNRLRWLGHVLRMPSDRLPRCAMLASPPSTWKKSAGGQTMTWQRSIKALTSGLSRVGNVRLPGWGPRDQPLQWLETLGEMAQERSQWRSCTSSLIRSFSST